VADDDSTPSVQPVTNGGQAAEQPPRRAPAQGNATVGAKLFRSSGCGDCHALAAADAVGSVGPDLDERNPDVSEVLGALLNGPGDMPRFLGRLSNGEMRSLARYVATVTPD
jgi:mono/diheme cytochrome c family protein